MKERCKFKELADQDANALLTRLAPDWQKSLYDPGKVSEVIENIFQPTPGRRKWPKVQREEGHASTIEVQTLRMRRTALLDNV